jgi:hypothetical protein
MHPDPMRHGLVIRKENATLPNPELIVNMVGFLLEYGLSSLDTFILEIRVVCVG